VKLTKNPEKHLGGLRSYGTSLELPFFVLKCDIALLPVRLKRPRQTTFATLLGWGLVALNKSHLGSCSQALITFTCCPKGRIAVPRKSLFELAIRTQKIE